MHSSHESGPYRPLLQCPQNAQMASGAQTNNPCTQAHGFICLPCQFKNLSVAFVTLEHDSKPHVPQPSWDSIQQLNSSTKHDSIYTSVFLLKMLPHACKHTKCNRINTGMANNIMCHLLQHRLQLSAQSTYEYIANLTIARFLIKLSPSETVDIMNSAFKLM